MRAPNAAASSSYSTGGLLPTEATEATPWIAPACSAPKLPNCTNSLSRRHDWHPACSYRDLAGGPLLMALIAGEAAELFEAEPVAATAARLMGVLRSIFIPQGIKVPDPVQVRRSCIRASPCLYV